MRYIENKKQNGKHKSISTIALNVNELNSTMKVRDCQIGEKTRSIYLPCQRHTADSKIQKTESKRMGKKYVMQTTTTRKLE